MATALRAWIESVRVVFQDEVRRAGGTIDEEDGAPFTLFLRASVPDFHADLRPGKTLLAGAAIQADRTGLALHPWLALRPGAAGLLAPATLRLAFSEGLERLAGAVRECLSVIGFRDRLHRLESLADGDDPSPCSLARSVLDHLARLEMRHAVGTPDFVEEIDDLEFRLLARYVEGDDPTWFGAVLATATVATEAVDPLCRWRIQELAGVLAGLDDETEVDADPIRWLLVERPRL